jgi:hypothetical protein
MKTKCSEWIGRGDKARLCNNWAKYQLQLADTGTPCGYQCFSHWREYDRKGLLTQVKVVPLKEVK